MRRRGGKAAGGRRRRWLAGAVPLSTSCRLRLHPSPPRPPSARSLHCVQGGQALHASQAGTCRCTTVLASRPRLSGLELGASDWLGDTAGCSPYYRMLLDIPDECAEGVLGRLDARSLCSVARACSGLRQLAGSDPIWRRARSCCRERATPSNTHPSCLWDCSHCCLPAYPLHRSRFVRDHPAWLPGLQRQQAHEAAAAVAASAAASGRRRREQPMATETTFSWREAYRSRLEHDARWLTGRLQAPAEVLRCHLG